MKTIRYLVFLALLLGSPSLHAQGAASPRYIPFQAQVTDQNGQLVADGQYSVIFNLYDTAVGGQPVWSERHVKIGVTGGALNVFLGSIATISGVDFSTAKYLGITVDVDGLASTAEPEMVPRSVIIPAFHAKTAEESTKLAGRDWSDLLVSGNDPSTGEIQAAKIEANAITVNQMGTDSVDTDEIKSGAVTTDEIADGTIDRNDLSSDVLNAIMPAGSIVPFAGPVANIPDGWLLCDGSPLDGTVYPNLFAAIGTAWGDGTDDGLTETNFRVPDLRGMFLRGVSHGDPSDPDAASRSAVAAGGNAGDLVGSGQGDALASHRHSALLRDDNGTGGGTVFTGQANVNQSYTGYTNYTGGNETRPKNAYVNYIIKY